MKLLFVDEEITLKSTSAAQQKYMAYYINALTLSEIDFEVVTRVDDAIGILEKRSGQFDVISIDIIMPPGERFSSDDTLNGARTGLRLLEWIIARNITVSVIVLTNVNPFILRRELPSKFGRVKLIDVVHKPSTSPFSYVRILERSTRGK